MREIRFRAWDKTVKKMHYLTIMNICFEYSHLSFEAKNGDLDGICEWPEGDESDIENQIIMQYTGLKDKNGKEIYEGDILKLTSDSAVVTWINEWGCYKLISLFKTYSDMGQGNVSENYPLVGFNNEIIGNIYENSELLKPTNENKGKEI